MGTRNLTFFHPSSPPGRALPLTVIGPVDDGSSPRFLPVIDSASQDFYLTTPLLFLFPICLFVPILVCHSWIVAPTLSWNIHQKANKFTTFLFPLSFSYVPLHSLLPDSEPGVTKGKVSALSLCWKTSSSPWLSTRSVCLWPCGLFAQRFSDTTSNPLVQCASWSVFRSFSSCAASKPLEQCWAGSTTFSKKKKIIFRKDSLSQSQLTVEVNSNRTWI